MTERAKPAQNRLIRETSPYLRQHAQNPVDWYPWGDEALQRARDEDKPILLSIGYSACHWCHVMERESFSDPGIAELMNRFFVNIKVDREERPDLDHMYQMAAQMLAGQGGWPLTVFLTPDLRPFFAGTYFPPDDRYGRPGFRRVLMTLHRVYANERQRVDQAAAQLGAALQSASRAGVEPGRSVPAPEVVARAARQLVQEMDRDWGGFGTAPKFPSVPALGFLHRVGYLERADDMLSLVDLTLRQMARGGIYDHLGGGFHRYSVDRYWRVPHFEKMLYDNALLAAAYLEGWQRTKDPSYGRIVRETLAYALREMRHPQGGFFSSQDADSEGEEGRFFVWTPKQVREVLGEPLAGLFCQAYGVEAEGNFDGHASVLWAAVTPGELADMRGMDATEVHRLLAEARRQLFHAREQRSKPHRDDKILTDWNGLMISALARAYGAFGEPQYLDAARGAERFIRRHLTTEGGDLLHSFTDRPGPVPGYLDDYAFFAAALIDLYEVTLEPAYLEEAQRLVRRTLELFWDEEEGGFFFTPEGHEGPLERPKQLWDQAVPSGNGVMAMNLLRLNVITEEPGFIETVERLFARFSILMERNPWGTASLLSALDQYYRGAKEIALAGPVHGPAGRDMLHRIHGMYIPHRVITGGAPERMSSRIAAAFEHPTAADRVAVYVCENFACSPPATEWEAIEPLLQPRSGPPGAAKDGRFPKSQS
ncbi:MAG: thioredoxin domain-containing protein [Firmicutes bacterium]|nr:thioredoxin domain-containing protein [Bacillota bacterium]